MQVVSNRRTLKVYKYQKAYKNLERFQCTAEIRIPIQDSVLHEDTDIESIACRGEEKLCEFHQSLSTLKRRLRDKALPQFLNLLCLIMKPEALINDDSIESTEETGLVMTISAKKACFISLSAGC